MTRPIVIHGDMREALARLIAEGVKVQSVCCDPPYHLTSIVKRFGAENAAPAKVKQTGAYARASRGFMGQQWDGGDIAFQAETWRLCWELLPPGGHLLAFGGDRTFHRLVCAIEDAGFEIRGTLAFLYGSGFPKSHNVGKKLDAKKERCSCPAPVPSVRRHVDTTHEVSSGQEQDLLADVQCSAHLHQEEGHNQEAADSLCDVRETDARSASDQAQETAGGVLQPFLPKQDVRRSVETARRERSGQEAPRQGIEGQPECGLEGRRDLSQKTGQLRLGEVREVSAGLDIHGEGGRLRDGTPARDGSVDPAPSSAVGDGASSRPQTATQRQDEPGTVAGQPEPQTGRAWPHCTRCGKPIVPDGLGTALKPAMELICLARKPLDGTVAGNVLKHGAGALNIDGCRVGTSKDVPASPRGPQDRIYGAYGGQTGQESGHNPNIGRWPANVLHDGSDEVVAAFPNRDVNPPSSRGEGGKHGRYGVIGAQRDLPSYADSGSAARFFYSSKADAADRLGSKHPTVKPVDLMRWLVRLVTPPGGTVLDPFAGSGTTGMACMAEGFDCILVEREAEYVADIRRRIAHVSGEDAPLFRGAAE